MSAALHWLVSRRLFLARVIVTYQPGQNHEQRILISGFGYSPIAVITVISFGVLLLVVVIANGFRRYRKGMPLAGSCSAAISAACH